MLSDQIALITGASRGIGQAIAQALGAEQARQLIEVIAQYEDVSITGFVSPPSVTRSCHALSRWR